MKRGGKKNFMAGQLKDIHTRFLDKVNAHYQLNKVPLKHPFPERPVRSLGILKIDGSVYESDKLMRIMVIMTNVIASSRCTRSIFLGPRPELYLPIFSSETILMGSKRAFLLDIHPTVRPERWTEINIEQRLLDIRSTYEELLAQPLTMKGRINDIMSKAHLYVKVPPHLDGIALAIFDEYLEVFIELVDNAATVAEDRQKRAVDDFENYHQTVINHDPAVKLYSMLFGKRGGPERVNDLFFAR